MNITEFVAVEAQKPFRWGDSDCISTADRWVETATGKSPLKYVGQSYTNEREATLILADGGGFALMVNKAMRASGFIRTTAPQQGDVGIIIHKSKLCMAIHAGDYWFSHDEHGLIGAPLASFWKAWRIECQ